MHWTAIVLIGIASNLDNLGIGMSFGVRSIKIPIVSNLIIAFLSMFAAYCSLELGTWFVQYVTPLVANYGGGLIIIVMGCWSTVSGIRVPASTSTKQNGAIMPQVVDDACITVVNHINVISWTEAVTLGLALSLNCIASGFGAGLSGVSPLWTSLSVGLFSLISVKVGVVAGHKVAQTWLGRHANVISGVLLIGTGVYEIFH